MPLTSAESGDETITVNHVVLVDTPPHPSWEWNYSYQIEVNDLQMDTQPYTAVILIKRVGDNEWEGLDWWWDINDEFGGYDNQYNFTFSLQQDCYYINASLYQSNDLGSNGVENATIMEFDYLNFTVGNAECGDVENDSDGDGVPDSSDECEGYDDSIDVDGDDIPDGCDPLIDSDGDGVPDTSDQCEGYDDLIDIDGDGIPDGCDPLIDSDGDGVQDISDECEGHDDSIDVDSDGIPDGCDQMIWQEDSNDVTFTVDLGDGNGTTSHTCFDMDGNDSVENCMLSANFSLSSDSFASYDHPHFWQWMLYSEGVVIEQGDLAELTLNDVNLTFSWVGEGCTTFECQNTTVHQNTHRGAYYLRPTDCVWFQNPYGVLFEDGFDNNRTWRCFDGVGDYPSGLMIFHVTEEPTVCEIWEQDNPDLVNRTKPNGEMDNDCPYYGTDGVDGDSDGDGVIDSSDLCEGFDDSIDVDSDGIPDGCDQLIDSDDDGLSDSDDQCPTTVSGATVDSSGCSDDERDSDGDGYPDVTDLCDNTPKDSDERLYFVETNGCATFYAIYSEECIIWEYWNHDSINTEAFGRGCPHFDLLSRQDYDDVRDNGMSQQLSTGGGVLWKGMVAFGILATSIVVFLLVRRTKNSEFDEEGDDDYLNGEDATHAIPAERTTPMMTGRQSGPDPTWQGVWGDDGYEWIEHPEGSDEWYWRDADTGQWVKH